MNRNLSFKKIAAFICCSMASVLSINTSYAQTINVACVGNSITAGAGVADSSTQSYPAQLRVLLGGAYTTINFGYSGATLAKNGDNPYWATGRYTAALGFNPNIVVIMLGTNDSKSWNWAASSGEFVADYKAMINVFRALPSKPKIFVATNSKAFSTQFGIDESVLAASIRPDEIQVANAMGTNVIDIFDTTQNYGALYADGIHPGVAGSGILAVKVKNLITAATPQITKSGSVLSAPAGATAYQWYLNGTPVSSGGTSQTLTISTAGTYSVGLKLNNTNQDRLMSTDYIVPGTLAIPGAPTDLTAGAGNGAVSLSWTAPAGADTYTIQRATVSGGPYTTILSNTSSTSYTNTGLTNGTAYYYVVTATNTQGTGAASSQASATPSGSIAGEPNNAYYYIGTDGVQAIVANPHAQNQPGTFDSAGTVEGWIRPNWTNSQASDVCMFSMIDWWGVRWGIYMGKDYGSIGVSGAGTTSYLVYPFQKGLWYHIASVFNASGTVTVYINGVSIGTSSNTVNSGITGTPFKMGISWSWSSNEQFIGGMDEVRVWRTPRTAAQIAANFLSVVPATNSDLIAYYKFNQTTGAVLPDLTSNANNGAMQYWGNNVAVDATAPNWVESYALAIPTAIAPASVGVTSFTASWTAPIYGTVENYLLDVSTDRNFGTFLSGYNRLNVGNVTSYNVTAPTTGITYYYRLSANKSSVANQGGLSNIDSTSTPVPVKLLSFTAQQKGSDVQLQWQTANEINNAYFNVQYSATGKDWTVIGKVQAKSGSANNYAFTNTPLNKTNYYRLQQVDKNGGYSYSDVVVFNVSLKSGISIFPNPVNGNTITVKIATSVSRPITYAIVNSEGVSVQKGNISNNQQTVNIGGLTAGSYVFKIINEEPVLFIKE